MHDMAISCDSEVAADVVGPIQALWVQPYQVANRVQPPYQNKVFWTQSFGFSIRSIALGNDGIS